MAGGIYAITAGDRIIYVGKTKREFTERFKEHKRAVEGKAQAYRIHELIRQYKAYGIQPFLIPLHYAQEGDNLDKLEHEYSDLFKPIGNQRK